MHHTPVRSRGMVPPGLKRRPLAKGDETSQHLSHPRIALAHSPPHVRRMLIVSRCSVQATALERSVAMLCAKDEGEFLEALVSLHALGGNFSMHLATMLAPAKTHGAPGAASPA